MLWKKGIKCEVCKTKVQPKRENTITISEGAFTSLVKGSKHFDAMNCPNCGCQILLRSREVATYECGIDFSTKGDTFVFNAPQGEIDPSEIANMRKAVTKNV